MNRIYSENEILDIIFKIGRFNTEAGDVLQKVQARQKQQTEEQLQQYKLEKDKINQEAKALEEEVIQRVEEVKAQIRMEEQSMFTSIQLLSQKDPYFDRTYMDLRYGLVNETTHEYDHINDVSVRMEMIKKDGSNTKQLVNVKYTDMASYTEQNNQEPTEGAPVDEETDSAELEPIDVTEAVEE